MQLSVQPKSQKIIVNIPVKLKRWGQNTRIIHADGHDLKNVEACLDPNPMLLRSLGRAYRWQQGLLSGKYQSSHDIAKKEGFEYSYVNKILRLNLLAPCIVEDILNARQPQDLLLKDLTKKQSFSWEEQCKKLGFLPRFLPIKTHKM